MKLIFEMEIFAIIFFSSIDFARQIFSPFLIDKKLYETNIHAATDQFDRLKLYSMK